MHVDRSDFEKFGVGSHLLSGGSLDSCKSSLCCAVSIGNITDVSVERNVP